MLSAIIIDDEPDCVKLLALQLKMYCPQVQVMAECIDSEEGLRKIKALQPDIVFLDIEMPGMSGIDLVRSCTNTNFRLVFITGYDSYAVDAFELSALHENLRASYFVAH